MILLYGEGISGATFKIVTITRWPRIRIAKPGDLAILQVTGCGIIGRISWPLLAKVPFGVTGALISTTVEVGDLLELGTNGTLRCLTDPEGNPIAQALRAGTTGSLIMVYWF